jgi:hypothetical protein
MGTPVRSAVRTLLAIVLVAGLLPAEAATVRRLALDDVRDQSASIFWGQVVDRTTRAGAEGKMAWTDYEISVTEHLKGIDPGVRTIVSFAGGTVGDLSVGIAGVPRLTIGQNYVFFIQDGSLRPTATVGWGQGLFRIERVNLGGETRDILVSYDGEPLQITAGGEIARGPAVRIENGSVWDASLRLDPASGRMSDPVFTAADGTAIPQSPRTAPEVTPLLERSFASIDDLRAFVDGKIGAARVGAR